MKPILSSAFLFLGASLLTVSAHSGTVDESIQSEMLDALRKTPIQDITPRVRRDGVDLVFLTEETACKRKLQLSYSRRMFINGVSNSAHRASCQPGPNVVRVANYFPPDLPWEQAR